VGLRDAAESTITYHINRGSHCAKGAAAREIVHGDRRLKYPMKLVNGQWTRLSWDQAINEIGDKLAAIREKSGPERAHEWTPKLAARKRQVRLACPYPTH
jgi:anaerobic selenocysteine-containing dehydrogenase